MSAKKEDVNDRLRSEQEALSQQLQVAQQEGDGPSAGSAANSNALLPMMLCNNSKPSQQLMMNLGRGVAGGSPNSTLNLLSGLPSTSASTASSRIQLVRMMCEEHERVSQESGKNDKSPSVTKMAPSPKGTIPARAEDPSETTNSAPKESENYDQESLKAEAKITTRNAELSPKRAKNKNKEDKPMGKKDFKWLSTLEELKQYKAVHGTCVVPRGYPENPKLASWVAEQRKQYKLRQDGKRSSINQRRIDILEELGFAWNAQEAAWYRHMEDLRSFKNENGHCHVPLNHEKYPKLGLWVKEQRRHYTLMKQGKQSHMNEQRAKELGKTGFCWDTHEATWQERLRELTRFNAKHGSCSVPTNYRGNPKLGTWVHHQRRQYKKFKQGKACHITAERIQALNDLGFIWNPRDGKGEEIIDAKEDESTASEKSHSESDRPKKKLKKTAV